MHRGDPAKVFENVLLADGSHREPTAGREHRRDPEEFFQQKNALGMMAKCPVPEVSHVGLAAVEPFVQRDVLARFAAVLLG